MTGATGFVGRPLVERLRREGQTVMALVRAADRPLPPGVGRVVADLSADGDVTGLVQGVDAIVHLAARVHVMRDPSPDPLAAFRRLNVEATRRLAEAAAAAGVRRFVYVSSVKVNGEAGVFTEETPPAPTDPYGVSKFEAEEALRQIARDTPLEVVIVRPPLVYGPGVGANFRLLTRAVASGMPLPFGRVRNRRSLVAVANLVDLLTLCLTHPAAANELFFASDGEDLSTPDLVRRLAAAMHRPARLLPIPPSLLLALARLAGRGDTAGRLLGTLQVDISKARTRLGWTPPLAVDDALRAAVQE